MGNIWVEFAVCMAASIGAGLGTGLAGMSAAAVIAPMLSTFLGVPAYQAIGIALASDVLASGVSAAIYHRNKNLDVRGGLMLLLSVVIFTYLGSLVSFQTNDEGLGYISVFMTFLVGMRFLLDPVSPPRKPKKQSPTARQIKTFVSGALIGFICGFVGAGGGMMMLIVLTTVLGYELKTAVGTSVFVMTFTAFTGAVSHFVIGGVYDWMMLGLCIVLTCLYAQVASTFATKTSEKLQKQATGLILVLLGIAMVLFRFL